jgi:hypothetical protein
LIGWLCKSKTLPFINFKSKFFWLNLQKIEKMQTINITAQLNEASQVDAVKAFLKALKIKFELSEKPYNPEFVAKMKKSDAEVKAGKVRKIKVDELWK